MFIIMMGWIKKVMFTYDPLFASRAKDHMLISHEECSAKALDEFWGADNIIFENLEAARQEDEYALSCLPFEWEENIIFENLEAARQEDEYYALACLP